MRKHFLLLMLLTLLPFSAWAVDLSSAGIIFEVGGISYGSLDAPTMYAQYQGDRLSIASGGDYSKDLHWDGKYYDTAGCTDAGSDDAGTLSVGKHYVKVTGNDPFTGFKIASFEVTRATLTVTFDSYEAKDYVYKTFGEGNPELVAANFTFTGWKGAENGDADAQTAVKNGISFAYTQATTGANANPDYDLLAEASAYNLTFTKNGTNVGNYTLNFVGGTMRILQKDLSAEDLTIAPKAPFAAEVTYKGAVWEPSYTVTLGETPITTFAAATFANAGCTSPAEAKAVGTYYVKLTFNGNYAGTKIVGSSFEITKAPMSVAIGNVSKVYKGEAYTIAQVGEVPVTYYGFQGEDIGQAKPAGLTDHTFALATGAKDVNDEGYEISITTVGESTNYDLTVISNGKLTITPAPLTITADDKTSKVGEALKALTYSVTGIQTGDDEDAAIATEPTLTKEDGNTVGHYAINVTGGEAKSNYTIVTRTAGDYHITAGALTITVLKHKKVYGDPTDLSSLVDGTDFIVTGAIKASDVTVTALTKAEGEDVGHYTLTAEYTLNDVANYDAEVTVVPGDFEITKAPLTVTLPIKNVEANITYAAAVASLTNEGIVITGFKKNEDKDEVADYVLALKEEASFAKEEGKLKNQAIDDGYTLTLEEAIFKNYAIIVDETPYQTIAGKLIVGTGNTAELVLNDNDDKFADITAANGETRNVKIILHRDQSIGGKAHGWAKAVWNCMVLPFEASARQISNALGYAIINVVDPANTTEGNVKFKLEMLNKIPANTPFFVKTDNDLADAYEAVFENVTIDAPETAYPSVKASKDDIGYNFVGAYDKYVIGNGKNEAHLRWRFGDADKWNQIGNGSAAKWNIVPFNAYMDLGATVGAREIIFTFEELDGSATSVRSIDIEKADSTEGNAKGWYNLNGVKMQNAPAQKGIYIHNGKKYVVK